MAMMHKEIMHRSYLKHKDKIKAKRDKLTAKKKAYDKEYVAKNKDRHKAVTKEYYEKNKEKLIANMKKYKVENKDKIDKQRREKPKPDYRIRTFKYRYGMTIEDYNILFENQEGKCLICGTHQSELKKPLNIDHCHASKNVRGLLCWKCNVAIGFFKDNVEILQNAIKYLNS
jgi:hypothetical protein